MRIPIAIGTAEPRRPSWSRRFAAILLTGSAAALLLSGGFAATASADGFSLAGQLPGIGSGRIWQVAFDPANNAVAAAATDHGVYLSSDGGLTWNASGLAGVRVWAVGFDARQTPATLYAGLLDGGIRVSENVGTTWVDASSGLQNRNVRCFAFSLGGIAAGTDDGVALSVTGQSWHDGGLDGDSISSLAVSAYQPTPVFIAGIDDGTAGGGYLFRSSATTGGWTSLKQGLPQSATVSWIAAGPLDAAVSQQPLLVTTSKGTFTSENGGTSWTASTGIPANLYLTTATFSPADPDLVYAGADAGGSSGGDLLRSTASGQSFSVADQGLPSKGGSGEAPSREVESIAVAATTPEPTVLAAIDTYEGTAVIYREIDGSAPTPPPASTASGAVATLPPAGSTAISATPSATPAGPTPTPKTSRSLLARVGGTVLHFPAPLLFEILFVALLVFVYFRWRRRYYVEGPP
jgi:hypothetical protein